jgi:hypothetical protein
LDLVIVKRSIMSLQPTLRHVPWTCRWGRFGGPIDSAGTPVRGFVFWLCGHPDAPAGRLLDRGSCEACTNWEAADEFVERPRLARDRLGELPA